jgi:enediyne biosynthesis protein E4
LVLLASSVALYWARFRPQSSASPHSTSTTANERTGSALAARFESLEARERELDRTVWTKEILAEECGRTIESLWDSINAATNKFGVVASFQVGELVLGNFSPPRKLAHGIELFQPVSVGPKWSDPEWRKFLDESHEAGWELATVEFRHNRFETDDSGRPRESVFYFRADLTNARREERATVEGDLEVDWAAEQPDGESRRIQRIDASHLTVKTRRGEPPFREVLDEQITPPEKTSFIDPLILYDLDGDGLSEIILAAKNLVYRRSAGDRYEATPLCRYPADLIFTGIIADFDGDGFVDFLCAKFKGLYLFKGSPGGTFDEPGRLVWEAKPQLRLPQALTCGDMDGDGDLDVFLGQYKPPYDYGQMPTPYYDANDGDPAYLLLNDGHGRFTDATAAAGLDKKRRRRSFSASFADLNGDGTLDLIVVSDFAGVDFYRNDGRGRFTDVTCDWAAAPHAFGMAHSLADFNSDGRLDVLMIGMNSPTADRLERLGLWRPDTTEDRSMRPQMTFGNRLFVARPQGGFEQNPLSESIARSGWSWGCDAFDFDNDGFPDVYVANGHESTRTVRDYERDYWIHDAYVGHSTNDVVVSTYFQSKWARTRGSGESYGGYEKNRLYLNQDGASFLEIGHLMGVALEEDSRCVVADDLDGDGRLDLLVTTLEVWPQVKQTLRVYKNNLADSGNWIGFRFQEDAGKSPVGAQVTVRYPGRVAVRQIVTGDSYRAQHANTVDFGLGNAKRVDDVEIRWANGEAMTLHDPALNAYHSIRLPAKSPARQ